MFTANTDNGGKARIPTPHPRPFRGHRGRSALAATFGVEPSYLVDREEQPLLDADLLEGMRDERTREIARRARRLPERERRIALGIEGARRGTLGARRRVTSASSQIWPPGRCANARSPTTLIGMGALMDLFGP